MTTTEEVPTITPDIVPDEIKQEITTLVQTTGIAQDSLVALNQSFTPLYRQARLIIEKSKGIVVTDVSQTFEIKLARECRLALKKVRIESDGLRKSLKEDSLRRGKAIDGFHNILLHQTEGEEARLWDQEEFVTRKEQERKTALAASRTAALTPYGLDTSFMSLGEMPDETFTQLLENSRAAAERKAAEAAKAEQARIEAENARLREEQRIREENEKLKWEAEEREAKAIKERRAAEEVARKFAAAAAEQKRKADELLAAEREKAEKARKLSEAVAKAAQIAADKKLADERAAREKLERDAAAAKKAELDRIAAEKAAEAKRIALEQAAKEAAEAAPDADKLRAVIIAIRNITLPAMSTRRGKLIALGLTERITDLVSGIEDDIATLSRK